MHRFIKLKNGAKQKWDGLPHHHRKTVIFGLFISAFLIVFIVNRLNDKPRAAGAPSPFIFRAIIEQEPQANYLILRGNILGSPGKVCFTKEESNETNPCPVEFPLQGWSFMSVRAKITTSSPNTGKIWLLTSEGIKSNVLEVSF